MMDRDLLALLACPACLGHLTDEREGMLVRCAECARAFPVRHGIPDLVWGKNPPNEGPGDTREMVTSRVTLDRRMVAQSRATARYVDAILQRLTPQSTLLDVGTGPGTIPLLVAEQAGFGVTIVAFDKSWPALDAARATLAGIPRTALVRASGRRRFPLRTGAFTVVARRLAPALPEELARVLAPGGTLVHFTYGSHHWQEVYDALPEVPRPRRQDTTPALDEHELRAQGFATASVEIHEEVEDVHVDDVILMLQSNPAAYFFTRDRDVQRLLDLSHAQGHRGILSLTTHSTLRIATTKTT